MSLEHNGWSSSEIQPTDCRLDRVRSPQPFFDSMHCLAYSTALAKLAATQFLLYAVANVASLALAVCVLVGFASSH